MVRGLFVYPIKSCGAVPVSVLQLDANGLAEHDRQFIIVRQKDGPEGVWEFVTQRQCRHLAAVRVSLDDDGSHIGITHAGQSVRVPTRLPDTGRRISFTMFDPEGEVFEGIDCGDEPAELLTRVVGDPVRLLVTPQDADRRSTFTAPSRLVEHRVVEGVPARYHDRAPLLVVNEASVAALAGVTPSECGVDFSRFRPNILVGGTTAYAEDRWERISTERGVFLEGVQWCSRCQVPTVEQTTGARPGGFKLQGAMRRVRALVPDTEKCDPYFGMLFRVLDAPVGSGGARQIHVGDRIGVDKVGVAPPIVPAPST